MMAESKMISVIVPVYNVAEYLPRCLDSILAGSYRDLEIICVNDGSKDNSLDILNEYKAKDPRIVIVDKANGGLSSARNAGLDVATGTYISFVDSDDWLHRDFYEALLYVKETTGATVATCGFKITGELSEEDPQIDYRNAETVVLHGGESFRLSRRRNFAWNRLYDRAVFDKLRYNTSVTFYEDLVLYLEMMCTVPGYSEAFCMVPLYYYFQRETSLMKTFTMKSYSTAADAMLDLYEKLYTHEYSWVVLDQAAKAVLASWAKGKGSDEWNSGKADIDALRHRALAHLAAKPQGLATKQRLILQTCLRLPLLYKKLMKK